MLSNTSHSFLISISTCCNSPGLIACWSARQLWQAKPAFCIYRWKELMDLLKEALFYDCEASDGYVWHSVSRLLTSTSIRSGSSPGSSEAEVSDFLWCRKAGCQSKACLTQSHCFAWLRVKERAVYKNWQQALLNQVSPAPLSPPWCLIEANVLGVIFVVGL